MNALPSAPPATDMAVATLTEIGVGAAPVEQQIEWLDAIRSDRGRYVKLLRNLLHSIRVYGLISYDRQGRSLMLSTFADGLSAERQRIARELVQHATDYGLKIDLMAAIERDGMIFDTRGGDRHALTLTIKRYLRMGGVLFIDQDGKLRSDEGMPAGWSRRGPNGLAIENAFRAWSTICRLPKMEEWAARFVRMVGYRRGNLIILEKRS